MTRTPAQDSQFARECWLRALQRVSSIERNPADILPILMDRLAEQHGDSPALVSSEGTLTYQGLAKRSRQYARWGLSQGLNPGDSICLSMSNCAEYLAVWLGLSRIGVAVALANTHLPGELLGRAASSVSPKLIIAGASQAPAVARARANLPAGLRCWVHGPTAEDMEPIEAALLEQPDDAAGELRCPVPPLDCTALFIYTSGTTGLPKAAKVSHRRVLQWSLWFSGMLDTGPEDRMYDCLPLFHSVGGVVATGATLVSGGAVVIRNRFSASDFWRDVREERCTLFQYIGELCRYLVNAPPDPAECRHALRIACGNGLRPEVWRAFSERFRIPRILEYYAATEGAFSLYNCEGEPGAIGRIPPFLRSQMPVELVRFDVDTGEPQRDAAGRCCRCEAGEVGEAIGKGRFEGYTDAGASERKMLRNVFVEGDAWYRSGDLMRRDGRGFFYFVDRIGDTFRWKGENVSTAEVQSVLATARGVNEAVVFGVTVPGSDGRAGMAALVVDAQFALDQFRDHVERRLPPYARPLFLRLLRHMDSTSTFKPIKQDMARLGFDPSRIEDPLYFLSPATGNYAVLDCDAFTAIQSGAFKF
jgi:fatty-acyl-CoA synthase